MHKFYNDLHTQHYLRLLVTILLFFVLLSSVLFYAGLWFLKLPYHALFQKPAFASIIFVELYGSSLSRFRGEQKVFRLLQSQHLH